MTKKYLIGCIIFIFVYSLFGYLLVNHLAEKSISYTEIYVARKDLQPFEHITEDLIETRSILTSELNANIITDKLDIIDHYVAANNTIYQGMLFYRSALVSVDDFSNSIELGLKADQVAYNITGEQVKNLQGSIYVDQTLDIYVTITKLKEPPIIDLLLKNVRIISIKDQKGLELNDLNDTVRPNMITLAIHRDYLTYLSAAIDIGSIQLYVTADTDDQECVLVLDSKVLPYLQ